MPDASEILFTWNEERLAAGTVVEIEDDTLDYTAVPVIDSSARRLGACLLAGSPNEVHAACDVVDLIEPEIVAKP